MSNAARPLLALFLAGVLVLAFLLQFLPSGTGGTSGGATSTQEDGWRAAFLLLEELDFDPEVWRDAPGHLPHGDHLLLLPAAPELPPGYRSVAEGEEDEFGEEGAVLPNDVESIQERVAELEEEIRQLDEEVAERQGTTPIEIAQARVEERWRRDLEDRLEEEREALRRAERLEHEPLGPTPAGTSRRRDPQHYLRFLEEGGTILTAFDGDREEFLVDELLIENLGDLWSTDSWGDEGDSATLYLRSGEQLAYDVSSKERFEVDPFDTPFEVLIKGGHDLDFAVRLEVGRGQLVLVPDDRFLTNEWIGEKDHALLLVRLVEESGATGRILFDDYSLGGWIPETAIQLAFAPDYFAFSLHLLLWLGLALWMSAWIFPFPRDPEPLRFLSPLARVHAGAGLAVRRKRWDLLAGMLRRGVLRGLAPRGTLAPTQSAGEKLTPEEVAAALTPLDARFFDDDQRQRARALFAEGGVRNEEELETLGRALARLERFASAGPPQTEATEK